MNTDVNLKELGFSQYEAACYMALVESHPLNGSQLSRISGIARSRIYDVLRSLTAKGYVMEMQAGQYAPLPTDELIRRLKKDFETHITRFETLLSASRQKDDFEYVWSITGYSHVMEKAREMIQKARDEIYVRLFPKSDRHLGRYLVEARDRGVKIRYVAMGKIPRQFDVMVMHPDHENLRQIIGGRSIEVITDKKEALVGVFATGQEDSSPINWTRNQWFIVANRDSLRHDFYHCFLSKMLDRQEELTEDEKRIYHIIKHDN